MSAHTKGPWRLCDGAFGYQHRVYSETTEDIVGEVVTTTDARLIAAAPELLEALEKIITRATNHPDDDDADRKRNLYHVQSIALDAIKKATGAA